MIHRTTSASQAQKVTLKENGEILNRKPRFENIPDSFEKTTDVKEDKSNNGKFDISECIKNFAKGVISPLTAIVKHPLMTIGVVGATVVACQLIPVLGPILAIGFGGLSAFQLGKGVYDVVKNYKNKDYDNAEKSFDKVGQGTVGVVMSALGLKQSAKVAKEAKLMAELNTNTLTQAQKEAIALEVKNGTKLDAIKEIGSLFTTKNGLKAIGRQFKPSAIKTRYTEIREFLDGKRFKTKEKEIEEKRLKNRAEEFKKTPEGVRRAALTDEEIQTEAQAMLDKAFDELGVPKDKRPMLELVKGSETSGGSYSPRNHRIEFSTEGYKSGTFEMEDVIMHEATHCKEALLRAGLPQERVDEIVKQELISRIKNGESEKIVKRGSLFGSEMMDPPKLPDKMKADFVEFAKENLYTRNVPSDMSAKLEVMMDKYPEFINQFSSREEALKVLNDYATSHNVRFGAYANVDVIKRPSGYGYNSEIVKPTLTEEEIAIAEKSLVDSITTFEGNGRIGGINGFFAGEEGFNQYQFSPEEVLAQKNGNKFLIKTLTSKLDAMKKAGTLTPEQEAYMSGLIEKAKMVIEYKTKGLEYYKYYTEMINNPSNKELAAKVEAMASELKAIKQLITPEEYEIIKRVIKVPDVFSPDLVTTMIPKSTLPAADILAGDAK